MCHGQGGQNAGNACHVGAIVEWLMNKKGEFVHQKKTMISQLPICSMYGIFTYIWVIYGVNVGKYSIHGAYGLL